MKKISKLFILAVSILLLLSACLNVTNNDLNEDIQPNENRKEEIVIRFAAYNYQERDYLDAISIFEANNPGVKVELTHYPYESADKYTQQINTALMAGKAPDIFSNYGQETAKLIENNYVTDLMPFIEKDESLNEDNYFLNLLDAYKINGGLFEMPIRFNLPMLLVNTQIDADLTEKYKQMQGLTIEDVIELFRDYAPESMSPFIDFSVGYVVDILSERYINLQEKTCNFVNEECINLLEYANSIKSDVVHFMNGDMAEYKKAAEHYLFYHYLLTSNFDFSFERASEMPFAFPKPLFNLDGTMMVFVPDLYHINAKCENKELAWHFIKTLLDNPSFRTMSLSINKSLSYGFINQRLEGVEKYNIQSNADPELYIVGDIEEQKNKVREYLHAMLEMPMKSLVIPKLYDVMGPILQEFSDGFLTAEQTAEKLQEKVSLVLNE